jgi:hypothetical protein
MVPTPRLGDLGKEIAPRREMHPMPETAPAPEVVPQEAPEAVPA